MSSKPNPLAAFRDRERLTYEQLGAMLGCHYSMAQRLCKGEREPKLSTLRRIERVCGVTLAEWSE